MKITLVGALLVLTLSAVALAEMSVESETLDTGAVRNEEEQCVDGMSLCLYKGCCPGKRCYAGLYCSDTKSD